MTRAIYRRYQHPEKHEGLKEVGDGKVKLQCETWRVGGSTHDTGGVS